MTREVLKTLRVTLAKTGLQFTMRGLQRPR